MSGKTLANSMVYQNHLLLWTLTDTPLVKNKKKQLIFVVNAYTMLEEKIV